MCTISEPCHYRAIRKCIIAVNHSDVDIFKVFDIIKKATSQKMLRTFQIYNYSSTLGLELQTDDPTITEYMISKICNMLTQELDYACTYYVTSRYEEVRVHQSNPGIVDTLKSVFSKDKE